MATLNTSNFETTGSFHYKKKIPPINIKTSDPKIIEEIKLKLKHDSQIYYMNTKIKITTGTQQEYKLIMDYANEKNL